MDIAELKAAILKAVNVKAEFEELGVVFTKEQSNANGWLPCHAIGREDRHASAACNLHTGVYKDLGGDGDCYTLFDLLVKTGRASDFKDAVTFLAKKAGLGKRIPKKWETNRAEDRIEFASQWNPLVVRGWLKKYELVTHETLMLVGSRLARYPKVSREPRYVIAWPAFGPELLDAPPRGYVIQATDGYDIELFQGKGEPTKPTKRLVVGDSGLCGRHGVSLIYEQDEAKRPKFVIKVEGISDLLTLQSLVPAELRDQIAVVSNAAGCSEVAVPQDFGPVLAGQHVVIIHDSDVPGQNGAKLWLGTVGRYCQTIRNIILHPDEITEKHGKDLRDWLAEHSFDELLALIEVTPPFVSNPAEASSLTSSPGSQESSLLPHQAILKRLGIVVLGHIERSSRITIFTERDGLVWEIRDIDRYKVEHLICHIGIETVEAHVNIGSDPDPARLSLNQIKRAIAAEANRRRIVDEKQLGAGVWELNGRLALVGAGQAMLINGGVSRTKVPFAEDRLFDFGGDAWFEPEWIEKAWKDSEDPNWSHQVIHEAAELFARWDNWRYIDTPGIVAGLLCCTWLQTLWPIRPLVAISGPTNSGKTIFLETVQAIFGKLAMPCAKPSEAGIRQNIGHTSRILIIDEFEEDWHRGKILELFRTSTRGQEIIRGDAAQRGRKFGLKHIPWVGAIELGLINSADANRFIVLELAARDKSLGSQLTVPSDAILSDLGMRLMIVAARYWRTAMGMLEPLRKQTYGGHDLRLVEIYSVPIAMLAAIEGWSFEVTKGALDKCLELRSEVTDIQSTEQELMAAIYTADVRIDGGRSETIGQLLSDLPDWNHSKVLEQHGVKPTRMGKDPNGPEAVFFHPQTIRRKLLRQTPFAEVDLKQILSRVPGAKADSRVECNGGLLRGILIPLSALQNLMGTNTKTF